MTAATKTQPVQGKAFRLALIQLGGIGPDKAANVAHARSEISKAVVDGAAGGKALDLVVLPEVWNSPYLASNFPKYAETINFEKGKAYDVEKSESGCIKMLSAAAKEAGVWLIGGSIPEKTADGKIYNSCPVFTPKGELVALHRKVHLFDIDIPGGITFTESETLTGGDDMTLVQMDFGTIGIGICYDVRFPELAMIAARKGAIAMIYPGAFNTTTGPLHWDLLQRARAVDNQIYVAMCSPARSPNKGDYQAWGYSGLWDPMGKSVAQLDEKASTVYADVDPEAVNTARRNIPVTVQRRFTVYPDVASSA